MQNSQPIYINTGAGYTTVPSYMLPDSNSIAVALGDVDNDGDLDLATAYITGGAVARYIKLYLNEGGTFNSIPVWVGSTGASWLGWGDVDGDGVLSKTDTITGDGARKLFYLSHMPIHKFLRVIVDGDTLFLSDYCFNLLNGWVSFKNAPANGSEVLLEYLYSVDLDLAITTEPYSPAIFMNTGGGVAKEQTQHALIKKRPSIVNHPNPFRNHTEIRFNLRQSDIVSVAIYEVTGRIVKNLYSGIKDAGQHQVIWNGEDNNGNKVASGLYLIQLQSKNFCISSKSIILVK